MIFRYQQDTKLFFPGLHIPVEITSVVKDGTPFGNQLKTKILVEKQVPIMSTNSEFFSFTTPISKIIMK